MENFNRTAFIHVNVIPMSEEKVLADQTVIIENGTIKTIDDAATVVVPQGTHIIDGREKYLMPALTDMHVHLGNNPHDLVFYLVNGVTTIRNMWGIEGWNLFQWLFGTRVFNHLNLKGQVERGESCGPAIITAGPVIEGPKPFFSVGIKKIKTPGQAERVVKEQLAKGYDFIKFYHTLPKDIFAVLVKSAQKAGLPAAGHVPEDVGIREAFKAGVTSIEHLMGFVNPYKPGCDMKKEDIPELAALARDHGVWNCPTLTAWERLTNIERLTEFEQEPEMDFFPEKQKAAMKSLMTMSQQFAVKKGLPSFESYEPFLLYIVRELKKAGAPILLGTDTGVPFSMPGFAVHRELSLLVKAGLTPYEAIAAGTIEAARCLGRDKQTGTLEEGKQADLILVNENPLAKVETIKQHAGVMKKGDWLSRRECDRILEQIAESLK